MSSVFTSCKIVDYVALFSMKCPYNHRQIYSKDGKITSIDEFFCIFPAIFKPNGEIFSNYGDKYFVFCHQKIAFRNFVIALLFQVVICTLQIIGYRRRSRRLSSY